MTKYMIGHAENGKFRALCEWGYEAGRVLYIEADDAATDAEIFAAFADACGHELAAGCNTASTIERNITPELEITTYQRAI